MAEQAGEMAPRTPGTGDSPAPTLGSPATVVAVLRERVVERYQGDDAWYLLNRFLPLVEHFGRLELHNGGRYHKFQWAVILTSPITAFLVGVEALTSNPAATLLKGAALLAALIVTAFTALLHAFGVTSVSWTVDSLVVVTSDVVSVPPSAEQCREAGVDIWTAGAV